MTKNRSRRDQNLRLHIAYLAARMIAEDGVADYASAKQKAARQAGLSAQYAPGTEGGRPIEMKTRLAIRFQL